jgi:hypothetical protein
MDIRNWPVRHSESQTESETGEAVDSVDDGVVKFDLHSPPEILKQKLVSILKPTINPKNYAIISSTKKSFLVLLTFY